MKEGRPGIEEKLGIDMSFDLEAWLLVKGETISLGVVWREKRELIGKPFPT